jgi:hypothetical protein
MAKSKHIESWSIMLDVFNLLGRNNINSFYWIADADGQEWRSPNYLTGRMFNFKVDVKIK